MTTELRQLLEHTEWADALVWSEVVRDDAMRDDGRILELLHHVHLVQHVYVDVLQGDEVRLSELDDFADADEVVRWGREGHARLRRFTDTIEERELGRRITFPWAEQLLETLDEVHPTDVRQALLQVASHSTYHRGQVATRIRECGGEPPLADFVAWVWAGRPEPAWPAADWPEG